MEPRLKVVKHDTLWDAWPYSYQKASEKGYPIFYDFMNAWVLYLDDEPIAYTGSFDMGFYYFIGNTYILPQYRNSGYHSLLLKERNKHLTDKPKITILNPIEDSQMENLVKVVQRLGYKHIWRWLEVSDIMTIEQFKELQKENQQIWRID